MFAPCLIREFGPVPVSRLVAAPTITGRVYDEAAGFAAEM
jgi:hypothetical protein